MAQVSSIAWALNKDQHQLWKGFEQMQQVDFDIVNGKIQGSAFGQATQ